MANNVSLPKIKQQSPFIDSIGVTGPLAILHYCE